MRGWYSLYEMAREAGVPKSNLDRLVWEGHLVPDQLVGGRGTRAFSQQARFAIRVVAAVWKAGANNRVQAKVCRFCVRARLEERFARGERFLVAAGEQVWIAKEEAEFTRVGGAGPVAFIVVDLAAMYEWFQRELAGGKDAAAAGESHEPARA